jgi:hypothetical protein
LGRLRLSIVAGALGVVADVGEQRGVDLVAELTAE